MIDRERKSGGGKRPKSYEPLLRGDMIQPKNIEWLWAGRIPANRLTVLLGDPKVGKGLLAAHVAACVSRGWPIGPGEQIEVREPGNVFFASAEEDAEEDLYPRYLVAGGVPSRFYVHIGESGKAQVSKFPHDADKLEEMVRDYELKLVVIDPLTSFVAGDIDRGGDARKALDSLNQLAMRCKTTVVVIHHFNKGIGGKELHRGANSVQIGATARSVLSVEKKRGVRWLKVVDGNNKHEAERLPYAIENHTLHLPDGTTVEKVGRVKWVDPPAEPESKPAKGKAEPAKPADPAAPRDKEITRARQLLRTIFPPGSRERRRAAELRALGESMGISYETLNRARNGLGMDSRKIGKFREWGQPAAFADELEPAGT